MAVIMKDKVSVRGPAYFIQGDTQTQIVCFSVARYRDGVDLAQLAWSVHIKNAAGQEDVAVPHEQPDVRTDKISINWLVQGVATAAAGYMTFCLRGVGTDPEGEPLRWSSGDEVREVHAAQESEASGEQADKLSELDALIEYVAKELPAVVQAGTEAKQAAADAKAAAAETNEAIDRANRLAALPGIDDPGDQGKVLTVGKGEDNAPQWILSSQIDDTAVSAESTWSSKNTVERFLPEFSESGAAVECHPFPLCPLNVSTTFEPAQTGSGDPYPAGGGKNLLENTVATRTVNGIVFTANKDGTVTVNGTATADAWLEIKRFSADAPNFSGCVMSGCPAGGGLNTYFLRWSNNAAATATDDGKSTCVIPDAHTGSAIIAICVKSGVTASNLIFKPMIRLASITDDTYAPYSNIRPISGHDSLSMTRCGKNLLPNNAQTQTINGVTFTVNADGSVTANGTANATIYYVIGTYDAQPDVSYVLSGCPQGGGMNTYNLYSKYADRDDAYAYDIGGGVSFTAPASRNNMATLLIHPGVVMTDVVFKPMIRHASDPDATYEPYQGETYTAHLWDTAYGGTYDWSKGELMSEWKMVTLDGTESATMNNTESDYYNRFNYYGLKETNIASSLVELSVFSHFRTRRFHDQGSLLRNTAEMHSNEFYPIFRVDKAWSTVEEWTSYLAAQYAAGTPVQIAYKLAAPITIRLAPQEIMPLEGMNVLISNPGNTTVSGKLDPIYLHEQNKAAAAKLAGMETRLQALESAAVNNA